MSAKRNYIFFLGFRVYIGAFIPQRNRESPRACMAFRSTHRYFINNRRFVQNFVKNFLIIYETKSRRVEYRSRKFPRLFLRWKALKLDIRLALIFIKKYINIDKRFVKKRWFMRSARLYRAKCKISDFSSFQNFLI